MERLSALDAEFLHLEDDVAHMHIAGACVFADPPPSFDDLRRLVAAKLHLITRYRQRVRTVPFELGRPVWADDPHFDLDYHLRHTALPAPGDDAAFCRLMGRLMSIPLDRDRPLWETWLVEGLEGGRWALVFKIHHCLVDGVAGVDLLGVLLDAEPDPPPTTPQPWTPRPEPAGRDEGARRVGGPRRRRAGDGGRHRSRRSCTRPPPCAPTFGTTRGLARLLGSLGATPALSIEGTIGPHRAWAHSAASLDDVRLIRAAFGGTINDVVLAAVSGGYRDLLLARGDDANHAVVRSAVPVSTRHDDGRGIPDNRVSTLLYDLPVACRRPDGTPPVGQRTDDRTQGVARSGSRRGRHHDRQPAPPDGRRPGEPAPDPNAAPVAATRGQHHHHQCAGPPVPALLPRARDARVPPVRPDHPRDTGEYRDPLLRRTSVLRDHR